MSFQNHLQPIVKMGLALLALSGAAQAQTAGEEVVALTRFWTQDRFVWDDHDAPEFISWFPVERLAKAKVDGCFNGLGNPDTSPPCVAPAQKKTNQAYVWGLVKANQNLFFGTVANTLCLVEGGYLGMTEGQETPYWECQPGPYGVGDLRPPDLWRYNLNTSRLISLNPPNGSAADTLRKKVTGFRSAGQANGVTFIAGPGTGGTGIIMFAFDSSNGALLGAQSFPAYNDVRSWVTNGNQLYVGVGQPIVGDGPGGLVLRWRGVKTTVAANLFKFDVVGEMGTSAANLAIHKNRIYVSTWPGGGRVSALIRGPVLPLTGYTTANRTQWTKIWSVSDYEKDPLVAMTYGGGAISSFDGALFWGTMHVPFVATQAAEGALDLDANGNGTIDTEEFVATALGTHRSIAIFQGRQLDTTPVFDLLYGETYLPRYDPAKKMYTIVNDAFHKNGMNKMPRWGASGLGYFFNAYTWSMHTFEGSLYFGTFDWSQVARVGIESLLPSGTISPEARDMFIDAVGDMLEEGADLYRFDSKDDPAIAESLTGLDNDTNYGFRTLETGDYSLFVGTANPMNLHPDGGWELLKLHHD